MTLRPDGKYPDPPHLEGRYHGKYCPDDISPGIIHPEGQYTAHLCLVCIYMGGSHLEQYVH